MLGADPRVSKRRPSPHAKILSPTFCLIPSHLLQPNRERPSKKCEKQQFTFNVFYEGGLPYCSCVQQFEGSGKHNSTEPNLPSLSTFALTSLLSIP